MMMNSGMVPIDMNGQRPRYMPSHRIAGHLPANGMAAPPYQVLGDLRLKHFV